MTGGQALMWSALFQLGATPLILALIWWLHRNDDDG